MGYEQGWGGLSDSTLQFSLSISSLSFRSRTLQRRNVASSCKIISVLPLRILKYFVRLPHPHPHPDKKHDNPLFYFWHIAHSFIWWGMGYLREIIKSKDSWGSDGEGWSTWSNYCCQRSSRTASEDRSRFILPGKESQRILNCFGHCITRVIDLVAQSYVW